MNKKDSEKPIYGPTYDASPEPIVIPKGLYQAKVTQGGLHIGGNPTTDDELIGRYGPEYHAHMLKLELMVLSGGEASNAGMRCTTHLLLEGKAFWNFSNALGQAKLLDTLELFKAYNNSNDEKHQLPCFDKNQDMWEQFSCLFLYGSMADDHGTEFTSKSGQGLVGLSMAISVGDPREFNGQPSTGWINFKPKK
jgi:hypothetical protein